MNLLIDLALLATVVGLLASHFSTRIRLKQLQEAMISLGPVLENFSNDVDRSQMSVASMRNTAEDVATRITVEADNATKRISLASEQHNVLPPVRIARRATTTHERMIANFHKIARG